MYWDLWVEQISCYAFPMQQKKMSKLKKKIRQDLKKYLYQVIQPQQIFAEMIPITKLSGCKPIRIWFLTFWLHLGNLTWSEYWLERRWERRNTSRMSRHQSMSGRGTHAFSSFACSLDWWWQTRYERTHIDMFGDGELLQCVTTDGPYVTVSCVVN